MFDGEFEGNENGLCEEKKYITLDSWFLKLQKVFILTSGYNKRFKKNTAAEPIIAETRIWENFSWK